MKCILKIETESKLWKNMSSGKESVYGKLLSFCKTLFGLKFDFSVLRWYAVCQPVWESHKISLCDRIHFLL